MNALLRKFGRWALSGSLLLATLASGSSPAWAQLRGSRAPSRQDEMQADLYGSRVSASAAREVPSSYYAPSRVPGYTPNSRPGAYSAAGYGMAMRDNPQAASHRPVPHWQRPPFEQPMPGEMLGEMLGIQESAPRQQPRTAQRTYPARNVNHIVAPFAEDEPSLGGAPSSGRSAAPAEAVQPGPRLSEPHEPFFDEEFHPEHCAGCGEPGCWDDGMCDECCNDPVACERFHVCSPLSFLNESSVSFGVVGFKAPIDFGRVGNFGFTQTINVSDAIWHRRGLGYQFGYRAVESNFNGDQSVGQNNPRTSSHFQSFLTAGLFHRAFYGCGWQYGVVADYRNDRYYVRSDTFMVRSEISYVWAHGGEFGFTGIIRTQEDPLVFNGQDIFVTPLDQYRLFYRRSFANGMQWRMWGGGTDANSALLGADCRIPMSNCCDLNAAWNYLIPTEAGQIGGLSEGWGLGMNLVFYPGRARCGTHNGPYRALFDVADNSTFMTRIRIQ